MKNYYTIFVSIFLMASFFFLPFVNAVEFEMLKHNINDENYLNNSSKFNEIFSQLYLSKSKYLFENNIRLLSSFTKTLNSTIVNPEILCLENLIDQILEFFINILTNGTFILFIILISLSLLTGTFCGVLLAVSLYYKYVFIEPIIQFHQDNENNTLNVEYINHKFVLRSNIECIGSGFCYKPQQDMFVDIGDAIQGCSGEINLKYNPTNITYGPWVFT